MTVKSKFITKNVLIASDHAGFLLKEKVIQTLKKEKLKINDLGTQSSDQSVDYPLFAEKLCKKINSKNIGILICGTGIGMSMAANRYKNIRAALVNSAKTAVLSREHNNANILCIGSRFTSTKVAIKYILSFLVTKFAGGRHLRRVKLLG